MSVGSDPDKRTTRGGRGLDTTEWPGNLVESWRYEGRKGTGHSLSCREAISWKVAVLGGGRKMGNPREQKKKIQVWEAKEKKSKKKTTCGTRGGREGWWGVVGEEIVASSPINARGEEACRKIPLA